MKHVIKKQFVGTVGTTNLSDRESWLKKALEIIPKGKKILDAGAGELKYKKFCEHLDYVGQDFAEYDGQGNNEGKQTSEWDNTKLDIISDIINIPVPEKSFDAIMCIEVFEHIQEPALAVKEFARIIKPNGVLIITAPFCSITHFAPYYFANGYSKYWYQKILNDYGFEIDELVMNGNYFEYIAQEIRRLDSVEEEYGTTHIAKSFLGKVAKFMFLTILNSMSKNNKKSEELLCYGIQIRAHKR